MASCEVGGEADLGVAVAFEEFGEVVLVDEGVAGLEGGDFALVVIDADDGVSDLGEADSRDQADVTRANNCDLNGFAHGLRQMVLAGQCRQSSGFPAQAEIQPMCGGESGPKPGQAEESSRYELLP